MRAAFHIRQDYRRLQLTDFPMLRRNRSLGFQDIKVLAQQLGFLDSRESNLLKLRILATPETSIKIDVTVLSVLTVNVHAASSSETYVHIYYTTRRHIPEDRNLTAYSFLITRTLCCCQISKSFVGKDYNADL
jgi:hypothetical protein